ncbi:hypothetical protein HKCCE2091_12620 [Rhodobacterales bacterium HKCCE2091]|nr:hypothetical protein [Rhodobacterales bacterium HKCCE2091]
MTEAGTDAMSVYQTHLDRVGRAFWSLDFPVLERLLGVPTSIRTLDAEDVLPDWPSLSAMLEAQRKSFKTLGATEYHRVVTSAEYSDTRLQEITGSHRTYILRGGTLVVPPYTASQVLRQVDGDWRAFDLQVSVRNRDLNIISRPRPGAS